MYFLVFLVRLLLGRDQAGSWCLQLLRRDGRSENRRWSGLFFELFAGCWADPQLRAKPPVTRRPLPSRYGGRDVDRGPAVRARSLFSRRRRS